MNPFDWIDWMYANRELEEAEEEIYMFFNRAAMMNLISQYNLEIYIDYSERKFKKGKELEEYERYLNKEEIDNVK